MSTFVFLLLVLSLLFFGLLYFWVRWKQPELTDSPWFWVAAFSAMAILGTSVIYSKYSTRQGKIEQQSRARQGLQPSGEITDPAELARPQAEVVPIDPLIVILITTLVLGSVAMWRLSHRPRPPENSQGHSNDLAS